MSRVGRLLSAADGQLLLSRVYWCESFGCRLRGLMLRQALPADEGLLLVEPRQSRMGTAIHMLFVTFPIAAIWLDNTFSVVDSVLACPWHLIYLPRGPARYVLEATPELLDRIHIKDRLIFKPSEG